MWCFLLMSFNWKMKNMNYWCVGLGGVWLDLEVWVLRISFVIWVMEILLVMNGFLVVKLICLFLYWYGVGWWIYVYFMSELLMFLDWLGGIVSILWCVSFMGWLIYLFFLNVWEFVILIIVCLMVDIFWWCWIMFNGLWVSRFLWFVLRLRWRKSYLIVLVVLIVGI